MTGPAFNALLKKAWWLCAGEVGLMGIFVLVNDLRSGAVAFVLSCINAIGFYFFAIRPGSAPRVMTVRRYFNLLCCSLLAVSFAIGILVGLELFENRSFSAGSTFWISVALCVIAMHQAWRGMVHVKRRWKSADDVRGSIVASHRADPAKAFARTYDLAFFISISLLASLIGRAFSQSTTLVIGATLFALSLPYAVGAWIAGIVLVKRFIPNDEVMPGDDWQTR
jgi:hypothetical protein